MSYVEVQQITKLFGNKIAVSEVSLSIEKGEIYALLGESGSGKSTLLQLMAGLLDANQGKVVLGNKEVTGPAGSLVPGHEEIKLVHQDFDLLPNHTVAENISYHLRKYTDEYQVFRLSYVLELCKLANYAEKRPSELSGGEQQRVALACALAPEPELILLDEPFSHIDTIFRQSLKNVLKNIAASTETSLCLVTHESIDALSVSDKIGILKQGILLQEGTPQEIYHTPQHEYVAALMGEVNTMQSQNMLKMTSVEPEFISNRKVLIRPENVALVALEESPLHGKIQAVTLMGPYWRVAILITGEKELLISFSPQKYAVGEVVGLRCRKEHLILL